MNSRSIELLQNISMAVCHLGIETPQIVAIGAQSSGKSSVLEQILRRELLPRGVGLVTRCPIVLHIRKSIDGVESVQFDHIEHPVFDFTIAQAEIAKRMAILCGSNKGISETPVVVLVRLNAMLEMTLIDLPGLVKVPSGDQPDDIEARIERIALSYAIKESSVILALINANTDIATNEALKIAKKADPQLKRTLGVVTKMDLMDEGTNCMDILANKHPRLMLGYVGVINRRQQDIADGLSIQDTLSRETAYLKKNSVYCQMYPRIGSEYLIQRLNEIFHNMAIEALPRIRASIRNSICDKSRRLQELEADGVSNDAKTLIMLHLQAVLGIFRDTECTQRVFVKHQSGFLEELKDVFYNNRYASCFDDLNSRLKRSSYLFVPEAVFHDVVRTNIAKMCEMYIGKVDYVVKRMIDEIQSISGPRFEELTAMLNQKVCECIETQHAEINAAVRQYGLIQASHVNVDHPDFDRTRIIEMILRRTSKNEFGLLSMLNSSKGTSYTDNKGFEVKLLKELVTAYLLIVEKEMRNYTNKAVHYYFCNYIIKEGLGIMQGLQIDSSLLMEHPEIVEERNRIKEELNILKNSLQATNNISRHGHQ
ncbi:dynamin [Ordospora colligata]|uniref:Dynamin n=1 Tax=Ordospora colligata OC4 TaxID=1354746 RepID=A0A0B2UNB7_9MICR|nr:dynamin [Ordospora colligata OC4]KHN70460.1 dynamin [Ordospora colligata OC4]TBU17210.1 dynamin [Ordospora colligata]TBU17460.1 dynamin [Ordospora colligata]TBU19640.1 dynamin [Ordospora colligata]